MPKSVGKNDDECIAAVASFLIAHTYTYIQATYEDMDTNSICVNILL